MKRALTKLVIAHTHNKYRPHLLREAGIMAVSLFAIAVLVATRPLGIWISQTDLGASIYPAVLTDLANQSRIASNIGPLVINPLLEKAALLKAQDMALKGYFAHESPEGVAPWHWFNSAGYSYVYAGENLAIDFSESRDIQQAWMNSPGHRANILNPRYTEIGIAIYEGTFEGKPTTFVVELFASPKAEAAQVVMEPSAPQGSRIASHEQQSQEKNMNSIATVGAAIAGTSTGGVPHYSSWFEKIITMPSLGAIIIYGLLSIVIMISLGSIFLAEIRIRDRRHIIYGLLVLFVMGLFIYLEWRAVFSAILIA